MAPAEPRAPVCLSCLAAAHRTPWTPSVIGCVWEMSCGLGVVGSKLAGGKVRPVLVIDHTDFGERSKLLCC